MSNLTYDQLVEKVSKAICMVNCHNPDAVLADNLDYYKWEIYVPDARAAIATIAEAIKEQTEAMMEAVDCGGDKKDWLSGRAWKSGYRSMHAASPLYPEGK